MIEPVSGDAENTTYEPNLAEYRCVLVPANWLHFLDVFLPDLK